MNYILLLLALSVINVHAQENYFCKVRLPDIVNSYYKTLLPVLTPDGSRLYFDRKEHPQNIGGINDPDDIWYCDRLQSGYWSEPVNIGSPLNTESSNALFSIAPDGKSAFVASIVDNKSMVFSIATYSQGVWSSGKEIRIQNFYSNSPNYFATMNADQNVIVFSINRNETLGELDLYASFLQNDGMWSEPLWLGPDINSIQREGSPYLANDGTSLYYFSNGFGGYGGNDLFVSRRLDDSWTKWSKPMNLGSYINTSGNERSITLTAKGDTACIISTDSTHENEGIYFVCLKPEVRPQPAKPTITPLTQTFQQNASDISIELLFDSGKYSITQEMKNALNNLCGMAKDGSRHAIVTGFTDDIGSNFYNKKLALRRAQTIAAYLKTCGITSFDIIGEGINKNINSEYPKKEQRRRSRKVELLVTLKM